MNNIKVIDIGSDFSKKPFGRYREDGKFSGSRFRDEILIPALDAHEKVEIDLDGVISFGSSFLEESFGGTVRTGKYTSEQLREKILIKSTHKDYIEEIFYYINNPMAGV